MNMHAEELALQNLENISHNIKSKNDENTPQENEISEFVEDVLGQKLPPL